MPDHVDVPEEAYELAEARNAPGVNTRAVVNAAAPAITAQAVEAERERLSAPIQKALDGMRAWEGASTKRRAADAAGQVFAAQREIAALADQEGDADE